MATFDVAVAPTDPARIAATKAFAAGGGPLSREAVAAVLAERYGITAPKEGTDQSTYTPPTPAAGDYTIDLAGVDLPAEANPTDVAAGAAEFCAALSLPAYLGNAIGRDLAGTPDDPDPAVVAKAFDAVGIDYADAIKLVDEMIGRGTVKLGREIPIKAASLSAFALSQLYAYAQVEQRRAKR